MNVRALSNELGSDYRNVHTDVRRLEQIGRNYGDYFTGGSGGSGEGTSWMICLKLQYNFLTG